MIKFNTLILVFIFDAVVVGCRGELADDDF